MKQIGFGSPEKYEKMKPYFARALDLVVDSKEDIFRLTLTMEKQFGSVLDVEKLE